MAKHVGKASVTLDSDIYIIGSASVAGTKEKDLWDIKLMW